MTLVVVAGSALASVGAPTVAEAQAPAPAVAPQPASTAPVMVPMEPAPAFVLQTQPTPAPVFVYQPAYAPPTYTLAPPALTEADRDLLAHGEYSDGEIVVGGVLALAFGFGTGQLVQSRWSEIGWLFTLGEIGSIVLMVSAAESAASDPYGDVDTDVGWIIGGMLAFTVLRVWETIDAFVTPGQHNRRLRRLQFGLGLTPVATSTSGGLAWDGLGASLSMRF